MCVIPIILKAHPDASFGFIGSRIIDLASRKVEGFNNTQRFRVYRQIVQDTIGPKTFEHFVYQDISGYLLINRNLSIGLRDKEKRLVEMFTDTYEDLLEV